MNRASIKSRHLLICILILYFALVFNKLGSTSLWIDEIMSMDFCDGSVLNLFRSLRQDVHSPLFYMILMVFIKICGLSEFAGRLPAVLAGAGCILSLYSLGKEIWDRRFALLSCLILAVSPFFLEFSREIHPYSLSALFSVMSWFYFVRIMKTGKKIDAVGYAISSGLLLLTFYLSILVVISQLFLFLFLRISRRKKILIFLGWIGAGIVFSVWLPVFFGQFMTNKISHDVETFFPQGITLNHVVLLLSDIFLGSGGQILGFVTKIIAPILFLIGGILLPLNRKEKTRVGRTKKILALCPVWMFWGLFLLFTLLCLVKSLYLSRYMTMSAPFAALFLALAIASIQRWWKYVILFLLVFWALLSYRFYLEDLPREDWKGPAQYLIANAKTDDVIVSDHVSAVSCLAYYFTMLKNPDLNDNIFTYEHFYTLTGGSFPHENRSLWYLTKRMGKNERLKDLRKKNVPLSHVSFLKDFELYSFKGNPDLN